MLEFFRNLVSMRRDRNEAGASAVEYGLLIAGIAALVAVAVITLGGSLDTLFDDTNTCVGTATADACD